MPLKIAENGEYEFVLTAFVGTGPQQAEVDFWFDAGNVLVTKTLRFTLNSIE